MLKRYIRLGVNIDHTATVRQARRTFEPDPVYSALIAQQSGADSIVAHLREDRRHIQDRDLELILKTININVNMEMAATDEMVEIATRLKPYQSTIVPERREEITTEGGLRVYGEESRLKDAVKALKDAGIVVSLFIDPELKEIDSAKEVGAEVIELHTGEYANATSKEKKAIELNRLRNAAEYASSIGLEVSAGHGLTYYNVRPVAEIEKILELNIGHTIIARSIFTGLERAIKDMITIIRGA
ncbi:MAG: pyridoxine 5'-phosphate synthase [Candidatus Coatesbacteria bacterium]|nr:MAG: pyridoxine 5'-phosphate synthase [Candidatus Coatesbacteria bacterium]RLC44051.1 MAG: pyridoxine 5'-phosphate synthase [Candidatus Coatesbacteria bacterium]